MAVIHSAPKFASNEGVLDALTKGDTARAATARTELTTIGTTLAGINRQLRKDFPDYAELVQPGALTLADTQARLKADEAEKQANANTAA